jgi:hypothetical protein
LRQDQTAFYPFNAVSQPIDPHRMFHDLELDRDYVVLLFVSSKAASVLKHGISRTPDMAQLFKHKGFRIGHPANRVELGATA